MRLKHVVWVVLGTMAVLQGCQQKSAAPAAPAAPVAPPSPPPPPPPDPKLVEAGAKLFTERTCVACHGKDAKTPLLPNYPRLTGQYQAYAEQQMRDIKSGVRANGQTAAMKGIMPLVADEEIPALAAFLAAGAPGAPVAAPPPGGAPPPPDPALVAVGAKLFTEKTCVACHGVDARTPLLPNYPRLSGQNQAYAAQQMADIKSGARNNGQTAAMKAIMATVSDDDVKALAAYLTSLRQ